MQGDECHRQAKLVTSTRNKPMHNARKVSNIRTLGECLLRVKGVKLQMQNDTRLSDNENKDEGLYNELKVWKPTSGSKVRAGYMQMQLQLEHQDKASKQL